MLFLRGKPKTFEEAAMIPGCQVKDEYRDYGDANRTKYIRVGNTIFYEDGQTKRQLIKVCAIQYLVLNVFSAITFLVMLGAWTPVTTDVRLSPLVCIAFMGPIVVYYFLNGRYIKVVDD